MERMGHLRAAVEGLIRDNGGAKTADMETCRVMVSDGEDFRYTGIIPDRGPITLVCEAKGGEMVFRIESSDFLSRFETYCIGVPIPEGLEDRIIKDLKRRQAWEVKRRKNGAYRG